MPLPFGTGVEKRDGVLEARNISVSFQGIRALSNVDLALRSGEIVGLIGPNGAGKTTFVNVMTGFQDPTEGTVHLDGADISDWSPETRSRTGIVRTFQAVRLFPRLSVLENLEAAGVAAGESRTMARQRAMQILQWLGLDKKSEAQADTLPFGEERRIGIGRALALQPRFLLLDEPAAGLTNEECDRLGDLIREIRSELKCGIILIEHKISLVFRICDRIVVLDGGQVIAEGNADEIRENPRIRAAYLGTEAA